MTWIEAVIAAPVVALIAVLLWKVAEALRRRGVVVRPVSMMDASMSKVEKQFAEKQRTARPADLGSEQRAGDERGV